MTSAHAAPLGTWRWRVSWSGMAPALGATSLAHAAQTSTLFEWAAGTSGGSTNSGILTDGSTTITASLTTAANGNSGAGFSANYNTLSWFPAGLTLNSPATNNSVGLGFLAAGSLQTISFSGGTVTNPILFLTYGDPGLVIDLAGLTFTTLGSGSQVSQTGTSFTFSGSATNQFDDGIAVQLTGTFSTISFTLSGATDTMSLGLAANLAPVAVPGAGLAGLATLGLAGASRRRR
ncbi:MAG: hypothetical protein ACO38W_07245 [Phycisphaerales bacterium]